MDHNGLAIPFLQLRLRRLFLLALPICIRAGDGDSHGVPVRQVAQVDGPFQQFLGGGLSVLAAIVVAGSQDFSVLVEAFHFQHPVRAAERQLHVRVDLNTQGAVRSEIGLIPPENHQAQAGNQACQTG